MTIKFDPFKAELHDVGLDNKVDYIQWVLDSLNAPDEEGVVTWNSEEHTLNLNTGLGPVLQVGQELYTIIYNGTGATIPNAYAVNGVATFEGRTSVTLADASFFNKIANVLITTMEIPNGTFGIATTFGLVRGVDTSLIEGFGPPLVYVSATTPGKLTRTRPEYPDYRILVGGITQENTAETGEEPNGILTINIQEKALDTLNNTWDGSFRETINFQVTSDGDDIIGTLENQDFPLVNLTTIFSDGLGEFDTTSAPRTVSITPGSDTNEQTNYIYVDKATKTLQSSTSDWPVTIEHIKVAEVAVLTATKTLADGSLRNQNWNDHVKTLNDNGHLLHIAERLRQENSKWDAGCEGSVLIGGGNEVWVKATAGVVYQLHRQQFPAFDMEIDSDIHMINDFTTPYKTLTDLSDQTLDASGDVLNNTSYSIVVWGVMNKTGQPSHIMANMPIGTFNKNFPETAVEDATNKSVYDIPKAFQGVGFLIARFTFVNTSGVWSLYDTEDLRGKVPNTTAGGGGGGGGGGVTTFLGLTDTPSAYADQAGKLPSVNDAETALEFVDVIKNIDGGSASSVYLVEQIIDGGNASG